MVTRSPFLTLRVRRMLANLADLVVQLAIGDVLRLRGIVALPDDRGLVAALVEMPVDAVPGDVEHAVLEPFDRDLAGREGGVLDLGEGLDPVDALGLFGPEAVGIADRARIHFAVLGLVDKGALGPFRGHVVNLLGHRHSSTLRPADAATASRLDCCHRLCVAGPGRDKAETSPTLVGRTSRARPSRIGGYRRPDDHFRVLPQAGNQRYRANGCHDRYLDNRHATEFGTRNGRRLPPKWPPRGRQALPEPSHNNRHYRTDRWSKASKVMMDQQNFEATRPVSADPAVALAEALGQLPKAPAQSARSPPSLASSPRPRSRRWPANSA